MYVLTLNGEMLFKGDPKSLRIIFNNLVSQDEDYKRYMQSLVNLTIKGTVRLLDDRGNVVKQQNI